MRYRVDSTTSQDGSPFMDGCVGIILGEVQDYHSIVMLKELRILWRSRWDPLYVRVIIDLINPEKDMVSGLYTRDNLV